MSIRSWTILGIIWVISLLGVGAVASAQARMWKPVPVRVLFGEDVGFRIEGLHVRYEDRTLSVVTTKRSPATEPTQSTATYIRR
jgi:hypothetical protein